jgi:ATP-grasp domain-containing protein
VRQQGIPELALRRVLIVNSDRMEPVRLLAARSDIALSAICKPKYAALYEGIAKVGCVSDVGRLDEVLAAAYSLISGGPFDAVVAALERSVVSAALVRSYFGIQGTGLATAAAFANKLVMKQRLRAAGVPVAGFAPVAGLSRLAAVAEGLGWPVVLKPAVGAGSQRTWRFSTPADVASFLASPAAGPAAAGPLLAERYVEMTAELHCDAVVCDGRAMAFSASRYFTPLLDTLGGIFGSYTLRADDELLGRLRHLHDEVAGALGLRSGVTHLEVFETPQGLIVGEIACRPGGAGIPVTIRDHCGWDIWQAYVATSLGERVPPPPGDREGVGGWIGLPGRNGLIVGLTPAEHLAAIPGIRRVDMYHRPGQVVEEKLASTFAAGMAYLSVSSYQEAMEVREKVQSCYRIEALPVSEQAAGHPAEPVKVR